MSMITTEEKKQEAIRRMKALGYFDQSIRLFNKSGKVMINEPPVGAHFFTDDDKRLTDQIKEREERDGILVYAVVRAYTSLGIMDSLLFVEDCKEEWEYFDEDRENGILFSYTINYDDPYCSEYGSIGFTMGIAAGIIRVS